MRRFLVVLIIALCAAATLAAGGSRERPSGAPEKSGEKGEAVEKETEKRTGEGLENGTGEEPEDGTQGQKTKKAEMRESLTLEAATLKGPSGFGMIQMFEEAPELGDNVEAEFQVLPTPQEMVARVAGGDLDFAVFPSNMGAKLYTEGPGYKLGAVVGLGLLSVVSRDGSIEEWTDLKGRRVYSIGKGATPDFLFRYLMEENGVDPEEELNLDFSVRSGAQLAQLLIGEKAETAVLPEPFVTMVNLRTEGEVDTVLDFQEEWKKVQDTETTYPITVVVVKPSLVQERPEVVERFLDSYRDSIEWVKENPADAAELIEKYDVLPAALAEPAIPNCNLTFIPSGEARTLMENYLQVLLDFNPASVGGALPDEDFYLDF
ncbi:MAG: ABC transporter substrate-binding protein [Spirochaetia bacterium]